MIHSMKRSIVLLSFLILVISYGFSQSHMEYNVRGDQALQKKDYNGARTWYSAGLQNCDIYSIEKLSNIWVQQESLRRSLNRTMRLCFDCLKSNAEEEDPKAMHMLSDYYKMGIGTEINTEQSDFWLNEYVATLGIISTEGVDTTLHTKTEPIVDYPQKSKKSFLSNRFYAFTAYTYSPTMPYGVTVGGFSNYGFYLSYKTNGSANYDFECNNKEVINTNLITEITPLYRFEEEKWQGKMITGGLLFPLIREKLLLSIGSGYAERDYFRRIVSDQTIINDRKSAWCLNTEASYQSVVFEVGGLYKWKRLILSGGINSTGFKDLDAFVGLGVCF